MTDKLRESSSPTGSSQGETIKRVRNLIVVLVAIALSVSIVLGFRSPTAASSLAVLAEESIPLDWALSNGKPTLMEFYANWCTACQAMADDLHELKQEYSDRINFVMLNVDNSKWLPELLSYRVDGIPHFVFLDQGGQAIASVIGEQPRQIMADNLDALSAGADLPHVRDRGRTSVVEAPAVQTSTNDDPRSHGSQVVSQ